MSRYKYEYDIAVSFASEDRSIVEEFVSLIAKAGVRVFYDAWEQPRLWGKDLYQYLDRIYRRSAYYCVIFISDSYIKKAWTTHELRSAQARALNNNVEYILPIRVDDTELPGLPSTIAYMDLRHLSIGAVAQALIDKLEDHRETQYLASKLESADSKKRVFALALVAVDRRKEYLGKVIELLARDDDPTVRAQAAWALDNFKSKEALPVLLDALHDDSFGVRSAAGWALVHLGVEVKDSVNKIFEDSSNQSAREMARLVLDRI